MSLFKKLVVRGESYYASEDYPNQIFSDVKNLTKITLVQFPVKYLCDLPASKVKHMSRLPLDKINLNIKTKKEAYEFIINNGTEIGVVSKAESDRTTIEHKIEQVAQYLCNGGSLVSSSLIAEEIHKCKINVLSSRIDQIIATLTSKTKLLNRQFTCSVIASEMNVKKLKQIDSEYIIGRSKGTGDQILIHYKMPMHRSIAFVKTITQNKDVYEVIDKKIIP